MVHNKDFETDSPIVTVLASAAPANSTPITARRSSGCYIDLKIGGTIFSAAWICFNDFGFLSWVP
jgi:hypothetical protein